MAVWFVTLFLIDTAFLCVATKIENPTWISPLLVISAVVFVPLFLIGIFLMQTVFRKELQEDPYYSDWLKRQDKIFAGFSPENILNDNDITVDITNPQKMIAGANGNDLETQRIKSYKDKKGLFLVHTWRPSSMSGQVADIVVRLQQHGKGPLTNGNIEKVEYQLGPKFFKHPQVKTNKCDSFKIEVSAYGPMLCLARVYIKGEQSPILLERYINFDEI